MRLRDDFVKSLIKLVIFSFLFILLSVYLVYLGNIIFSFAEHLANMSLIKVGVVLCILIFLFSYIKYSSFFYRVIHYKGFFLSHCICHHCLSTVNLFTENDEEWECNYCKKSFSGNILKKCSYCAQEQRLFECSVCEKLIDINAEYNTDKLWDLRDEKQTRVLQQKNKNEQITNGS